MKIISASITATLFLTAGLEITPTQASAQTETGEIMTKVIIEDVPTFQPESDCGWMRFFGALSSVLKQQGEDADYAYLMGASGAAFRLKVHPEWCPSAQDPNSDDGLYPQQALTAMGYRFRTLNGTELDQNEAIQQMRDHIDKDIPVIVSGAGIHPASDFSSVVTGYEGDDTFYQFGYCHSKDDYDKTTGDQLLGSILLVEKEREKLSPLETLRQSFELALKMAQTEELNGYAHGTAAFNSWIARLQDADFEAMSPEQLQTEWLNNALNYEGLCDARGAAKRYLKRMQNELPPEDAKKLEPLVEQYTKIQSIVFENWKWFPFPAWVRKDEGKIWTPAGTVEGTAWSPEIRSKEIEALTIIRDAETEAQGMMQEFLAGTN